MSDEKKSLFKISGVGIDTTTMKFKPVDFDTVYGYIYTSISANNDYIIADYVSYMSGSSLIVGVDFLDGVEDLLFRHIKTLGREKADLVLIDAGCNWDNFNKEALLSSKVVGDLGIKNPTSVEQIEQLTLKLNEKLKFIAFDLSPFYFNYDIVKYCNENNITILSFNPLGGYVSAAAMIDAFSVPYLLSFSGTYSSIVFLSGRDSYYARESKKYLEGLFGKETKPIFTLRKNVSKLLKPIKRVVNTALKFDDSITINYDSPELLYDFDELQFSLGKLKVDSMVIDDRTLTDVEKEVKDLFNVSSIPSDINSEGLFALYRYQAFNYIKVKYIESLGWSTEYVRLGDKMIAIKVERTSEKGWFRKTRETEKINYFFAIMNGAPVFLKIQNSVQKS